MMDLTTLKRELLPLLKKAEKVRKRYRFFKIGSALFIVIILLGFTSLPIFMYANSTSYLKWMSKLSEANSWFSFQTFMVLYWIPFFVFLTASQNLKNKYKGAEREILKTLLKKTAPEFAFNENLQITSKEIEASKLIPNYLQVDTTKSHTQHKVHNLNFGLLSGKIRETSIKMGDVKILNQSLYGSYLMYIPFFTHFLLFSTYLRPWLSKKHSIEQTGSSFLGMFAIMDFNKRFNGTTVVLPDRFEKRVGYLAKTFQQLNLNRDPLVNLEDPEFEKEFVVYSTDQVEARYILTPSLMQRITRLKRKINKPIMLSFKGNRLYMGVKHPYGFFSLNESKNLTTSNAIEVFYEDITAAMDIVEDLNLNTKIWKQ
ncbi:DUF3137 domain-containing protein [Flagellimonas alvinocaridis]|uniref:DUF3137 domain-containing protein n=1 Tax=Flagellimonas alvinocaridis TaxID=2530200 RepID=A0A4S8RQT3_9FLAO|nr:DUF3137 domain-containing protein [Allomuricauda alvinocaridis]THV60121.1 DUF3137 domain-containing protein [Allomuricauda alvinocaridis]